MEFKIDIYGESHTRYIGATVSGMPINQEIDNDEINFWLTNRQGKSAINTARKENEKITFLSGVKDNIIINEKIAFVLENKNYRPKDYEFGIVRPSHADIVGYQCDGFNYAYEGGGRFSGRLTALYVVIGIILKQNFELKDNFKVSGQIKQVADIIDDDIMEYSIEQLAEIDWTFAVLNPVVKQKMLKFIQNVKQNNDSHGARLKFRIDNVPVGLGGMYFDSFESILSRNLYAIGGVKGVLFGYGYAYQNAFGSQVNDSFRVQNDEIIAKTNYQGGINGGFSNGVQPIYFETIIRPTPTIFQTQQTVKLTKAGWENYDYTARGRHDSFIANRIMVVIYSMIYISLYELSRKGK